MESEVATWTRPFLHEMLEEIPKNVDSLVDVGCGRGIVGAMTRIYRNPKRLVELMFFQITSISVKNISCMMSCIV